MDNFFDTLFGLMFNDRNNMDIVGNDKVGEYIIDTCYTVDQGYETGICKGNGNWVIVQRYPTREKAELGHKNWMIACAASPTKAYSVQFDEYIDF